MANKPWFLALVVVLCIVGSAVDYSLFYFLPSQTAFYIHNLLATICAVLLVIFAWRLIARGAPNEGFHFIVLLMGLWMFLAHLVKLWYAHCI